MALYEYECEACGQRFELIRKFSESEVEICTLCGKGPVKRLFSSPAIQFKGSGFYITDYAQKGRSEGGSSKAKGDKPATSDAGSGDAASSDTAKSNAKGDSKSDTAAKPESSSPAKSSGPAKD
jgi:putative FmdB family regulatory protein